jgi:transcriptional regulator of heat shock response
MGTKVKKSAAAKAASAAPTAAITDRQAKILAAIVSEYSKEGKPVGSSDVSARYRLAISPATIRSEMGCLEDMGYIVQPHTSAGRVPTDLGYRYFVTQLMARFELSMKEQHALRQQLAELSSQHQEVGKKIAKLLAAQTEHAAFALLPDDSSATGLSNLLQLPQADQHSVTEVAQFFENIDEYGDKMLVRFLGTSPEAFIGKGDGHAGSKSQMPELSNHSLIVSKVKLKDGGTGLIGIVGPKSMRYDRNMSLIEYVSKFLSSGALVLLVAHLH